MGIARPERVYRYAIIATVGSVLGAIFGWFLGHYAYEYIARPMLAFYGSLVTSGLAHLPPMKVVSIVSGALAVNLPLFVGASIVARGLRFAVMAWLLRRYGEPIREFIEKRLGLIAGLAAALLILLFVLAKFLHG